MKRILSFLILLPTLLVAQENSPTASKLAIGFTFSPDYSYRSLSVGQSSIWMGSFLDYDVPKFGYTTGFNLAYNASERIKLETGLLLANKGMKTKDILLDFGLGVQEFSSVRYKYNFYYLDVPFKVNYYLSEGKTRFYLTAGLSANVSIAYKVTSIITENNGETRKSKDLGFNTFGNRFQLAALGGLGIEHDLNDKLYFKLEPIYRRALTSFTPPPIRYYFYSIGLNTGIFLKL